MESNQVRRRIASLSLAGLLAGIIVMGVVTPATAQTENGTQPPKMVFSSTMHNAGLVERGEMITHQFTFRNTGGSDLVILSTKAG